MRETLTAAALFVGLAACTFEPGLPSATQISCDGRSDCPGDMICEPVSGRCIDSGQLLGAPCEVDGDCDDGQFCNGVEHCLGNHCQLGEVPCVATFDCLVVGCLEAVDACDVVVDHQVCPDDSYCAPGVGCAPGIGCHTDDDCQDSSECNGQETCSGFRCVAGTVISISDGDECTIDGCDDARIGDSLPAIYHIPDVSKDGNRCDLAAGGTGICVASKAGCVQSACGDGVIDAPGEACDDGEENSAAWSPEAHCNDACTGLAPHCGDGTTDGPHETCDDGDANDDGNGCGADCQRNDSCGNGVLESLFEECDDSNDGDACDGCLDGCAAAACNCYPFPGDCPATHWCNDGSCEPCDTLQRCGPQCLTCAANAYCAPADGCRPCADTGHCGPTCEACDGTTPVCAGPDIGCVVADCSGQPNFARCSVTTEDDVDDDICLDGVCISPGENIYPDGIDRSGGCSAGAETNQWLCNAPGLSFSLPDTEQRTCTDASGAVSCPAMTSCSGTPFCGQDAQYGWDTSHTEGERFARSEPVLGEPVTADTVTGLMWQGCTNGSRGTDCSAGYPFVAGWADLPRLCDELRWADYGDWRVPSLPELQSIIDYGENVAFGNTSPAYDPTAFPLTPRTSTGVSVDFGTSTAAVFTSAMSWTIDSEDRGVKTYGKTAPYFLRCVRGRTTAPVSRFVRGEPVTDEPVVDDVVTGLTWQGCAHGLSGASCDTGTETTATWEQALAACEGLVWGDTDDWRLPDVKELRSIVDSRRYNPSIEVTSFPGTPYQSNSYWTATADPMALGDGFVVSFGTGLSFSFEKTSSGFILRCVRGGS